MFLGTYTPRLDDKGRLFLPAKFRDDLAEGLVLTRGQEHCLYVWRVADFRRLVASYNPRGGIGTRANRDYRRMIGSDSSSDTPDRQGRITIPLALRNYARLGREVAVIGALNRVEVWDSAAWTAYTSEHEEDYSDWSEDTGIEDEEVIASTDRTS